MALNYIDNKVTKIPVGILYSLTGPYGGVNASMVNAAILGLEEANAELKGSFELEPFFRDCHGKLSAYTKNCELMIYQDGCQHIIGCYTSAARKQILPLLERTNTLLWHSARYEGFEASENVLYLGASPNQHLIPLVRYILAEMVPEIYCVGSNYIWTWESNRLLREQIVEGGGRIIAQRLVPMGDLQIDHIISEIISLKPPVVFNTLVGEASYRFYRALWRAVSADPDLKPGDITVVSCSLCEEELPLIGEPASIGHLTSATYFRSLQRQENIEFLARYRKRFGVGTAPSVDAESAYVCARMLGRSIAAAGTDLVSKVRDAAKSSAFEAPEGTVRIDHATNHSFLTPRLAVSTRGFSFKIIWEAPETVDPDPFLVWQGETQTRPEARASDVVNSDEKET
ncbi:amino acid/amide ABC transporter substrate-binding protein, HAAT family [Sulfitobacter brevis]|uniref:Amino acid/amide ABC transporter substrate-binding protein, HAAT family n=1 Tax=Sulfitobacter brevis TaxID=74348 RepID=A0A1I2GI92_9RHOB|nr:transporter substrate-binding domain-containing protein [Sulfitobacter brevis]SFF16690.1 amino acid/amide ABC transporter substrate-binding protein, HAAT family [Sulfitobacter brevis]